MIYVSTRKWAVFSVILIANVQVIAAYDAVIGILKLLATHRDFNLRKRGCGYLFVS